MAEDDDDKPRRRQASIPNLTGWSVEELDAYIRHLESEKARARGEIEKKQATRLAAEALFKKPRNTG